MQTSILTLIGHDWVVALLLRAIETRHFAHAYLISGIEHIGKTTLARWLAQSLNCTGQPVPCGQCRSCKLISAAKHPDVHLIVPESNTLKIDQVRTLQHDLALSPVEGRHRVAIIEEMEKATAEASNALLKILEEPPPSVVLILIAPEPEALLPTIVSRCQPIALRPLSIEAVCQALIDRWHVDDKRADKLAHLSGGKLGWAVMAAQDEAVLARREQLLDDLLCLIDQGRVERFAYAEEMASDSQSARETLRLWQMWWRDVMLVAGGSQSLVSNLDRAETLLDHARRFGLEKASSAASAMTRTVWQIEHNANARLALEALMLDLPGTA